MNPFFLLQLQTLFTVCNVIQNLPQYLRYIHGKKTCPWSCLNSDMRYTKVNFIHFFFSRR
uniref:Uncharacterized protein n=1 Tax=Anguilla anguilla TaxID=7936 RepID=A0A0E9WML3_ANGAN